MLSADALGLPRRTHDDPRGLEWNSCRRSATDGARRGNHYFPPSSLNREYFIDSPTTSLCIWKGLARYYTLSVDGAVNPDAAWYYPKPSPLARRIKDHVAFWHGVRIEADAGRSEFRNGGGR